MRNRRPMTVIQDDMPYPSHDHRRAMSRHQHVQAEV